MTDASPRTSLPGKDWIRSLFRRFWSLRRFWPLRRSATVVLAGVLALVVLALRPTTQDAAGTPLDRPHALPVFVFNAQRANSYQVEERHAGVVAAQRSSALGFARSGLLSKVEVDEGDRVAAGQPLARLDTRGLEARAAELRSELAASRSRLEVASVSREQTASAKYRSDALARKEWVSKKAHDDTVYEHRKAIAERAAAESAVRHVEASLASLQVDLDQSVLTAPYAGTIVARRIDEGAAVNAGEPVMDLIESDVVEFRVGVPEKTAASLKVGEDYSAIIGGVRTPCRLLRLLPQINSSTRTVTAIFALPEMQPPPLSGMLGHLITRHTLDTPGFWLPLAALTDSRRGLWAAYVIEPEDGAAESPLVGVLSRRDVQLIHIEADRAFVSGVLRDGEQVVADGAHRLVPGLRVQAAPATPVSLGANQGQGDVR